MPSIETSSISVSTVTSLGSGVLVSVFIGVLFFLPVADDAPMRRTLMALSAKGQGIRP
jgi:hypothetical protein